MVGTKQIFSVARYASIFECQNILSAYAIISNMSTSDGAEL